jgi:hypothetical protein
VVPQSRAVKYKPPEIAAILALLVILPGVLTLLYVSERSVTKAREALSRQLAALSRAYSMEINGRSITRPEILVADLKRIKNDSCNHCRGAKEEWYRVTSTMGLNR